MKITEIISKIKKRLTFAKKETEEIEGCKPKETNPREIKLEEIPRG